MSPYFTFSKLSSMYFFQRVGLRCVGAVVMAFVSKSFMKKTGPTGDEMMKRALLKCLTSSFYCDILDELLHFDHMRAAELVSCSSGCSSNSKAMKVAVTRD